MIKSLQVGRGLAALGVVGFHFGVETSTIPTMRHSVLASAFRHGNAGVDFFFVLSGFIIMFAHARDIGKPDRLLRYIRNRFVRLYPIYWLYTAIILGAVALGFSTVTAPHDELGWISIFTLIRLAPIAAPLNVAWTLFYEVAFYAIFATLIINRTLGMVVIAVWLAAIVYFHLDSGRFDIAAPWASRLCLNFFIGMMACWAFTRIDKRMAVATLAGGLITIFAALLTADHGLSPSAFGSLIAIGCGLAICGAAALERFTSWNVGILANLGSASYTLYLVHVHVGSPLLKLAIRSGALKILNPDVLFALLVLSTVVISYLLYLFVEKPLLAVFQTGFARPAYPANKRLPA